MSAFDSLSVILDETSEGSSLAMPRIEGDILRNRLEDLSDGLFHVIHAGILIPRITDVIIENRISSEEDFLFGEVETESSNRMTRSLDDPDLGTSDHELGAFRKGIIRIRHELKEGSSLCQCGHRPQHVYPPLLAFIVTLLLRTTPRNESVLLLDER